MLPFISYVRKPNSQRKTKSLFLVIEDANGMNKSETKEHFYIDASAYMQLIAFHNDKQQRQKITINK